jgi:hypothetical protein
MKRPFATLFLLAWLVACTSHRPLGQQNLFDFLKDGATTRDEVESRFGPPNAAYEEGRILAFRVAQYDGGYDFVGTSQQQDWTGVRYSLVLEFDNDGLLRRHSLVQVRSP